MTSVEKFLEDSNYRSKFPEDLNPERTEWGDLYSWLSTAEYAVFDLLDENKALKKENEKLKQQIEKMKCCQNCKLRGAECVALEHQGVLCGKTKQKWELAE